MFGKISRFVGKCVSSLKSAVCRPASAALALGFAVALPAIGRAQTAAPEEALIERVTGVSTTASTIFMSIAGLSVTAFVIGMVISFAKKAKK